MGCGWKILYMLMKPASTHICFENIAMLQKVRKYVLKSVKKYKRVGTVAAKIGEKSVSPLEYDGTMDSVLFESWFEKCFIPVIKKETVIVMDNASFHRKKQLVCAAQKSRMFFNFSHTLFSSVQSYRKILELA